MTALVQKSYEAKLLPENNRNVFIFKRIQWSWFVCKELLCIYCYFYIRFTVMEQQNVLQCNIRLCQLNYTIYYTIKCKLLKPDNSLVCSLQISHVNLLIWLTPNLYSLSYICLSRTALGPEMTQIPHKHPSGCIWSYPVHFHKQFRVYRWIAPFTAIWGELSCLMHITCVTHATSDCIVRLPHYSCNTVLLHLCEPLIHVSLDFYRTTIERGFLK